MSNKEYSGGLLLLVFVASVAGWLYLSNSMRSERQAEFELVKPRMLELAKQGNVEAIRWTHEHGLSEFKDWSALYARLAELGDPQAMYFHAYHLESKDPVSAFKWYEKAAAKGYPSAVLKIAKPEKGLL